MSKGKDRCLEFNLHISLPLRLIPLEEAFLLLLFLVIEHAFSEVMSLTPAVGLGIAKNAI